MTKKLKIGLNRHLSPNPKKRPVVPQGSLYFAGSIAYTSEIGSKFKQKETDQ